MLHLPHVTAIAGQVTGKGKTHHSDTKKATATATATPTTTAAATSSSAAAAAIPEA